MSTKYLKLLPIAAALLFGVFSARGQTPRPGGVTTSYTWIAWLTPDSYTGGTWTNTIPGNTVGNFVSIPGQSMPLKVNTGYNYQQAVEFPFSGTNANAIYRLLSQNGNTILANENITMIFVLKRSLLNNQYDHLLAFGTGYGNGSLAWYNSGENLSMTWSDRRQFGPAREGIITVDNANNRTNFLIYKDGVSSSVAATNANAIQTFNNQRIAIAAGNNAATGTGYFGWEGTIQEIILLKGIGGLNNHVNIPDLRKIHSYLAVKYAITLKSNDDYVNSDGNVIWSRSLNKVYSNDIFGLGRDNKSGLHVKQATSSSKSSLIAYVGNLETLNSLNTTDLVDNTFILFGSNGQSGIANYPILPNTVFANTTITDKIDYRFKTTFKAQVFGAAGGQMTVNFKVGTGDVYLPDADILFVSSDPNFAPGATSAYPLTAGVATNVVVKNGDYLMFAKRTETKVVNYTQTLWLRAGDLSQADGNNIPSWTSAVGSVSFAQGTTGNQPLMNKNANGDLMNFHPSVSFPGNRNLNITTTAALDPNRSYYVFYVSQLDGTSLTSQYVAFAMRGAGNFNGWYQKNPSFTSNSTVVAGQQQFLQSGAHKNYGITGVIRPNTTTDMQSIYLNGDWQKKPAGTVSTTATGTFIGGSTNATTPANAFNGKIQEIMVFESTTRGPIDPVEAQKINSYLAFKYGLTLEIGDYIDKSGNVIWSRAKAVDTHGKKYENTIFGLGRNDAMNVYQKQARGYNKPYFAPFAVFVGTTLQTLNQSNTGTIGDNEFLMFAADQALRSYRALPTALPPTVVYRNNESFSTEMNYTSAVFQVQAKNWPVGTKVNFKNMTASAMCYLMVSKDPLFEATATDIYKFDPTTNLLIDNPLEIEDGDYLSMVTWGDPAPGGVFEDLRLWLNPVASKVTLNGNLVTRWDDFSSNGIVYIQPNTTFDGQQARPVYSVDDPRMNFHPSVVFNDKLTGGRMHLYSNTGIMNVASPNNYIFFTVLNNDFAYNDRVTERRSYPMGFGSTNPQGDGPSRRPAFGIEGSNANTGPTVGMGIGRILEEAGLGVGAEGNGSKYMFRANSTIIMTHEVFKGSKLRYEFNLLSDEVSGTTAIGRLGNNSYMSKHTTAYGSTLGGASLNSRYLHGPLSEIFAYERELDAQEKDAIASYLGLKYGITLRHDSLGNNFDYTLSDNTDIWPGTSSPIHSKYHNKVASLVRDDNAWLNNKRSHSTETGSILFMGIGTDGAWTGFAKDKQAITWGDDDTPIDQEIFIRDKDEVCGEYDVRLRKIWLVDNSTWELSNPADPTSERVLSSQKVVIRLDSINFPYPAGTHYQIFMLIADSDEDLYGGTSSPYDDAVHNWNQSVESKVVNGQFQFEYTFKKKYTYFTLGVKELGGACPTCGFSDDKTVKFANNASSWPNGSRNRTYNLGGGFTTNITVTSPSFYSTAYPQAYTNNTLRLRRGTTSPIANVMETTIKPSVAAAASFEIYEINAQGTNRYDYVEITGKCNGEVVYPRLSYMTTAARSSYVIAKNTATGRSRPTTTYTALQGRMKVRFPFPVEEITIKYRLVGAAGNSTGQIGLGPITFNCPNPLPPVNEAGLSFVKSAPKTIDLCQRVEYVYEIYNNHCSPRLINLHDTLPQNMAWVSLLIGDKAPGENGEVNSFKGQRILTIKDMEIPGGKTFTVKAVAEFTSTSVPGTYTNSAKIEYTFVLDDVPTDGVLISKCSTVATGDIKDKLPPVEWTFTCDKKTFQEDATISYTLKVENKANKPIPNTVLTLTFPEEFTLVGGTITTNFPGSPPFTADPGNVPGFYQYNDITLNALSSYTVTFKLKAPTLYANLPRVCDSDGNPVLDDDGNEIIADLETGFEFSHEDPCMASAFEEAKGIVVTPYGKGRDGIISNRNVTSTIK